MTRNIPARIWLSQNLTTVFHHFYAVQQYYDLGCEITQEIPIRSLSVNTALELIGMTQNDWNIIQNVHSTFDNWLNYDKPLIPIDDEILAHTCGSQSNTSNDIFGFALMVNEALVKIKEIGFDARPDFMELFKNVLAIRSVAISINEDDKYAFDNHMALSKPYINKIFNLLNSSETSSAISTLDHKPL